MELGQQEVEGVTVVAPTGHLDSKTSPELEALLVGQLDRGSRRFLIDFSDVETISSAALRVLLMFTRRLVTVDGNMALASLNSHVRQVFDISGFTGSFRISESRAAGLKELGPVENRAGSIGHRAARALGIEPPDAAARGAEEIPATVSATGALALRLLGQADVELRAGGEQHRPPAGEDLESSPDSPLAALSGGSGKSPGSEPSAVSGLWHRLRRRIGGS